MNSTGRTAIAITCLASLSIAHAEWKLIGTNDQGTFYVDEATLNVKGNVRSFLVLDDMKLRSAQGDRSIVAQQEVDCGSRKFRSIKTTYFSKAMGRGSFQTLEPEMNAGAPTTPKVVWLDTTVGQPSEKIVHWACKSK